jgi:protein SCO1/2
MSAPRLAFAAAALAAAALGVATWVYLEGRSAPPLDIDGYVLLQPRPLPDVELVDESAARFPTADFAGHWSFLYLGYTYCPDVCPLTLVALASLKQQLAAQSPAEPVQYFLVSIDPQRDTPERLREYVAYFDPTFRGLTGSPAALMAVAQATNTLFEVPASQEGDNYLVSHSSNVVLLDPEGRVYAIFTPPHRPSQLAADFATVIARYAVAR